MALLKEAILQLKLDGFAQAETAAGNVARAFDQTQASVAKTAQQATVAATSTAVVEKELVGAQAAAAGAAANVEKVGAAARTAQAPAANLASTLSRAAAAASLGASILGTSDSPLLHGVGQVFQGTAIGAGLGGPAGAAIGGGIAGLAELAKLLGGSDRPAEIHNHITAQVGEGAVRDAARQAGDATRTEIERRLEDLRSDLYSRTAFSGSQSEDLSR